MATSERARASRWIFLLIGCVLAVASLARNLTSGTSEAGKDNAYAAGQIVGEFISPILFAYVIWWIWARFQKDEQ